MTATSGTTSSGTTSTGTTSTGTASSASARALVLVMLRQMFPAWDIRLCDRGIWRAEGPILISASSCDGLVQALGDADPEALAAVLEELRPPI
ncbi:hypothetical protein DZF91_21865 [Actinomadura logoneensis]|uniref:Uncharacterized protein n=1 Tax=Actinomadura logoneensis TaxID=2293572 RepID=A0A372JHQ0_9ACTN|nr:hypothetical protein [Actinomadura logoneensis]RFU39541.1 hypothetical protein DZF91_21865 [Actinomadura logoneensis]